MLLLFLLFSLHQNIKGRILEVGFLLYVIVAKEEANQPPPMKYESFTLGVLVECAARSLAQDRVDVHWRIRGGARRERAKLEIRLPPIVQSLFGHSVYFSPDRQSVAVVVPPSATL